MLDEETKDFQKQSFEFSSFMLVLDVVEELKNIQGAGAINCEDKADVY